MNDTIIDQLHDQIRVLQIELKNSRRIFAALIKKYGINNQLTISDVDIECISPNDYIVVVPPIVGYQTTFKLIER